MDVLTKAKSLNNPLIDKYLSKADQYQRQRYTALKNRLSPDSLTLAELTNSDILPLTFLDPISHKQLHLTRMPKPQLERIKEQKMALEKLPSLDYFKQTTPNLNETLSPNPTSPTSHQTSALPNDITVGLPNDLPPLTISPPLSDDTLTRPTGLYEELERLHQTEDNPTYVTNTSTTTTITGTSNTDDTLPIEEAKSSTGDKPTTYQVTKKSRKTSTREMKKVSAPNPSATITTVRENLVKSTPVIYSAKQLQNKNTYALVSLYSNELTPEEIATILHYRQELHLTHAEITALSLLQNMDKDENSAKQYWKIAETMEKSRKPQTPSKPTSSLLDEKLASLENAVFGEIVEKPIDNPPHP